MKKEFDRKLVLENGREFYGWGFGAFTEVINEVIFNTSMVGYQEIFSDPSYTGQMVVMTYPLIGNYGINDEDYEARTPTIGGFVVREYNDTPSNFRYTKTLSEVMEEHGIPGISGVDTRAITRIIRSEGGQKILITAPEMPCDEAVARMKATTLPRNQVERVSCRKKWYSRTSNHLYNVVAVDCGIKLNIVRALNARGCNVTIVPYTTTAEEVLRLAPDGVIISNGPGNPQDAVKVIELIKALRSKLPIFGIGLGHQAIALAYGAKTYRMKQVHSGGNHPVKNLHAGTIEITSQSHSYAVEECSLAGTGLALTHINMLDKTVEGICCEADGIFSVQHHPEGAPGPGDSLYLFDEFVRVMNLRKEGANNA